MPGDGLGIRSSAYADLSNLDRPDKNESKLFAALAVSLLAHFILLAIHLDRVPDAVPTALRIELPHPAPTASGSLLPALESSAQLQAVRSTRSISGPKMKTLAQTTADPATYRSIEYSQDAYLAATAHTAPIGAVAESGHPKASQQSPVATPGNEDIVAPLFGLSYLDNPEPEYPIAARRRSIEGRVTVKVKVSAEGNALDVALEKTSGEDLLDRAALKAIKTWRFVPARRGGMPIEAYALVPISFNLSN